MFKPCCKTRFEHKTHLIMKNVTIILFLLLANSCFSQQKFNTTLIDNRDLKAYSVCEHHDFYYVLSTIHDNNPSDTTISCLYQFDSKGELTDSLQYKYNNNNTLITCIEVINDTITLIGYSDSETDTIFNIHILRVSDDLDIVNTYTYPFYSGQLYFMCTAHNSNGLIIGGTHIPFSGGYWDLHFIYINNYWEQTNLKTYDFYAGDAIYGLTTCNDTIYASVQTNRVNKNRFYVWSIDSILNYSVLNHTINYSSSSTIINDQNNQLLLSGYSSKSIGFETQDFVTNFRMSTNGVVTDSIMYGRDGARDRVAPFGSISASGDRIFCLSMQGVGNGTLHWFSSFPVNACLSVMDYDMNLISQTYLDDEVCYTGCKVVATSDGGCIFIATRYDYLNGIEERDLVVVKTDPDGIFTWTTEIHLPDLPNGIYPNPAKEYIHIKDQFIPGTLHIFGINGKQVLESAAKNTVDIGNLTSGSYVYRIVNEKGIVTSAGKMIVE